jgi:hypothetical protein
MNLLTDHIPNYEPSVGVWGGDEGDRYPAVPDLPVAVDPFLYQEMRWCGKRQEFQIFVEVFRCEAGRLGICLGCGEERIEQWTRTNSEAV